MDFEFHPMSLVEAEIIATWRYQPPYDFYDLRADARGLDAWISATGAEGRYSVYSDGELVGFFSFGSDTQVPGGTYSDCALDIGLGLKPSLTGKGFGVRFIGAGLGFAERNFSPSRFRLSVAEFNERAITVYRRAGFRTVASFISESRGVSCPFVLMERETMASD